MVQCIILLAPVIQTGHPLSLIYLLSSKQRKCLNQRCIDHQWSISISLTTVRMVSLYFIRCSLQLKMIRYLVFLLKKSNDIPEIASVN